MRTRLRPAPLQRTMLGCVGIALAVVASAASTSASSSTGPQAANVQDPVPSGPSPQRALLDRYCVRCHNEQLKTADLMLDTLDVQHVGENAAVWEKVVVKLRSGAMPPAGRPRPDKATALDFVSWLEAEIDRAAAANPNPGHPLVHRLNRSEYGNAIRDVLALEVDEQSYLPSDNMAYGFDNIADVLTVSPALLERYLSAAQKISRLAVGEPATIRPVVETYRVSKDTRQEDRASEDLPWGTRGGLAVRRYFPVAGEYSVKIRFVRPPSMGYHVRGFLDRNELELRLDHALVTQFNIGGGETSGSTGNTNDGTQAREQDTNFGYSWLAAGASIHHSATDDPALVEVRFPVDAGSHVVGVTFRQRNLEPEGVAPRFPTKNYSYQRDPNNPAAIDSLEIGGPHQIREIRDPEEEPPSRRQIFVCRPTADDEEERCAKTILSRLARRAYRRPVTEEDVQPLLRIYHAGSLEGGFDAGIRLALEAILVNPHMLFRAERDPDGVVPGAAYRVSDLELASRLSFFLWSSVPDDELVDLAARGELRDPNVLEQQVHRMLADERFEALAENFAGQWLHLRNLDGVVPDTHEFPDFDDELRIAFQQETELFFRSQLYEDRSVLDLLRANYTFLNERLARHYRIPNVYGSHFRRVNVRDDQRVGLLGHGSILTVTSYANRTSPVLRGKWILENVLGAPPPAPPADVPALDDQPGTYESMRERMEQHRRNPACAVCHAQIDPLGFAMENFDGIGQWRTQERHSAIDATGRLPDGTTFNGPAELRNLLVSREEEFVATVTRKLVTYALGRGVEYYDMPAIRQIMREAGVNDNRWSALILGIVRSTPFQMRRAQS